MSELRYLCCLPILVSNAYCVVFLVILSYVLSIEPVLHLFLTLRLVLHVEQKLLTLPEHPSSLPIYSVVRVARSLIVL